MTTAETIKLEQLDSRIRAVWVRGQIFHLVAGLLALCSWAIPLFLIGMVIDWMTYMPIPGRVVILITLLTVACHRGWRRGWRDLRPFDARRTALQLETYHGDLNSLLISALQFRDRARSGAGTDALRDQACRKAEEAASSIRPEKAVPYHALRRPATVAMILAGVVGLFAVVNGPFLAAGLMRIFSPWLAVAYPTNTHITLVQDQLVIKEGDSALIEARLSGVVPADAEIYLRTGEGNARVIDLDVTQGNCSYTIASASRDFTYRIKAGDDRTDWHKVRVIAAPKVERVEVDLSFPDYLARKPETIEALTMTVPEGTKVRWQVTLDRPIITAQMIRDGEPPLDLQVSEDGRQVTSAQDVSASRSYSFSWVEKEHGFHFTSPRYYLQAASDQAPRVELTSPEANLVAMIGRPLNMTVRAQDDYGIGSTKVTYRVNQRTEQVIDLKVPVQSGQGDQPIDWDYRTALPDLEVGDSVSFAFEVSDLYAGPQGPHIVRSETRQITFLSKEAYLEQIAKQRDRLLSQIQTVYRQQRGAHEMIRNLDPSHDGYIQNCQMEAIRQELVRDQLKEIAAKIKALLEDLAANNVFDAAEGESLEEVRRALIEIANGQIAIAASLLRDQSGTAGGDKQNARDPLRAARVVNASARELGSLVLLRSIDTAQEVYARENRMMAQVQASLRWLAVSNASGEAFESLAKEQEEITQWVDRLAADIHNGMHYDKRPLAILRLIRSVKDLRIAQPEARIGEAAALIRQGKAGQASSIQADLVKIFLDAEFSVRLSGSYSTLMRTRAQMRLLAKTQTQLREMIEALPAEALAKRQPDIAKEQAALRRELLTMLLPSIPAPRASLFDETPPQVPPVEAMLMDADRAMAEAIQQLAVGQKDAATSHQRIAEKAINQLVEIVDRWSVELGLQTQGLSTVVAATSERMSLVEQYEARSLALLEQMDIAAAEKKSVEGLVEPQSLLADELIAFKNDLIKLNTAEPDQDIPPLVSRLQKAERAMSDATEALRRNAADKAIQQQERAADALAEALTLIGAQYGRLSLLQDLMMFQRSVGFASTYMADIVAEQRDLIEATEKADAKITSDLMPRFGNLARCLDDVAPLLDLVAARLDVGTPLVFAKADLADAVTSLQARDKVDSLDAQTAAAESLEKVRDLVQAVQAETGYVAEIVEFLHQSVAVAAILEYRQAELAGKLQMATADQLSVLTQEQRDLLVVAEAFGKAAQTATGMAQFTQGGNLMRDALDRLEAKAAPAAAQQMESVRSALKKDTESLSAVITMLHGLPSIEVTAQTDPALRRLIDVLALASTHKQVFRQTQVDDAKALEVLAQAQRGLDARLKEIIKAGQPHPMLLTASQQLSAAVSDFQSSDRAPLKLSQKAADEKLRHFIIEQALILETAKAPAAASDSDPAADGPGSDGESAFSAGFISDFVSGEMPGDKRTDWKVLADRNRAALNQNFARELPLEYRGLLKNYYERIAK